nr:MULTISPECIES: methylamine utilization protein [unclassified Pseudoalteromonas]
MLLIGSVSIAVKAKTLTIVDQHGRPVELAVIELLQPVKNDKPLQVAVMDQVNKQFEPKLLTIVKGQQVAFPNSDDIRHHVYSFSPIKPFELKLYAGTPKAPLTFEQSGVVVLGCNIHDSMVGYIYVAQSEAHFLTDVQGKVVLPDNTSSYLLWHPEQDKELGERSEHIWPQDNSHSKVEIELVTPAPRNTFGEMFKDSHGN